MLHYMQQNAYSGDGVMGESSYRQAARLFHVLSHHARLHILDELRKDDACVCHLQTMLRRPQAYVSQQLRVLRDAGLVTDHKDGLLVYYRLADGRAKRLVEHMLDPAGKRVPLEECPCPRCQGG